jgi:hypothetical protein
MLILVGLDPNYVTLLTEQNITWNGKYVKKNNEPGTVNQIT